MAAPRSPGADTLPRLFRERVKQWASRTAFRKKALGLWQEISWSEYGENVRWTALGLKELGVNAGDKVTIISGNRPEWMYVDMGVQCLGGVSYGIHATLNPSQIVDLIEQTAPKVCVLENRDLFNEIFQIKSVFHGLKRFVFLDDADFQDSSKPVCMNFEALQKVGRRSQEKAESLFDDLVDAVDPEQDAIIINTDGFSEPSKGVVLTHENMIASLDALYHAGLIRQGDELFSFLPLSHIWERSLVLSMLANGQICNFPEGEDTVVQDILEVAPSFFGALPRVWEKFHSDLTSRMNASTRLEKKALGWALKTGRRMGENRQNDQLAPLFSRLAFFMAEKLVLCRFRRFVGLERVRLAFSLGGALPLETTSFYSSLGIDVGEKPINFKSYTELFRGN